MSDRTSVRFRMDDAWPASWKVCSGRVCKGGPRETLSARRLDLKVLSHRSHQTPCSAIRMVYDSLRSLSDASLTMTFVHTQAAAVVFTILDGYDSLSSSGGIPFAIS